MSSPDASVDPGVAPLEPASDPLAAPAAAAPPAAGEALPPLRPMLEPERPPVARLGGTAAPPIPDPPAMADRREQEVRERTGLTPVEHHDRIRQTVNRLSRITHRAQVRVVFAIEALAAALRRHVSHRADRIPEVTAAGAAAIGRAVDEAKQRIDAIAQEAITATAQAVASDTSDIDTRAEATVAGIEAALGLGTGDMHDAFTEAMAAFDRLASATATDVAAVPRGQNALEGDGGPGTSGGSLVSTPDGYTAVDEARRLASAYASGVDGSGVGAGADRITVSSWVGDVTYDRGLDLTRYMFERRSEQLPSLGDDLQQRLVEGANSAAATLRSEETKIPFTLAFAQLVNPAIATSEAAYREDAELQQTVRTGEGLRLTTARERAQLMIRATATRAGLQLDHTKAELVRGLRRAGAQAERAVRVQAVASEYAVLQLQAPHADAHRQFMARVRAPFVAPRFLDLTEHAPRLKEQEAAAKRVGPDEERDVRRQARLVRESADEQIDRQIDALWGMVAAARRGVERIEGPAERDIGGLRDSVVVPESAATVRAVEASTDFAVTVGRQLGEQKPNEVRTKMDEILRTSVQPAFFDQFASIARRYAETVRDMDLTFGGAEGPYRRIDQSVFDEISTRAKDFNDAANWTSFIGTGGTDEDKMIRSLTGLSRKGMAALQEFYRQLYRRDLRGVAESEMGGHEGNAALAFIDGDNVRGVRETAAATGGWFGLEASTYVEAMRGLSDVEVRANQAELTRIAASVTGIPRTDLQIGQALASGDRALAYALDLTRGIEADRRQTSQEAIVNRMRTMDDGARAWVHGIYRAGSVTEAEASTFRSAWIRAYAFSSGRVASREESRALTLYDAQTAMIEDVVRARTVTVHHAGHGPEDPGYDTVETREISPRARQVVEAVVRTGPRSPDALGSILAFQVDLRRTNGASEARTEALQSAAENPELHAARRAVARAEAALAAGHGSPDAVEAARRALRAQETRQDEILRAFARRMGHGEVSAARAREIAGDTMAELFAEHGAEGRVFGRSMITEGRADIAAATWVATHENGTHENLLRNTFRGRDRAEFDAARTRYAQVHPGSSLDAELEDELSGDELIEMRQLAMGAEDSDLQRARLAFARYRDSRVTGTGAGGRVAMAGTAEAAWVDTDRAALDRLILSALPAGAERWAFDEHGEPNPAAFNPDGSFRGDFRSMDRLSASMRAGTEAYNAELDRNENFIVSIIRAIGTIIAVALLVVSMVVPGLNVVSLAVAGIIAAAVTGAMTVAVKMSMRGSRYGYEEMGVDIALAVVETATAALGAGMAGQLGRAARMGAQPAFSSLGRVGSAMAREAITVGINSAAGIATEEATWRDGIGTGLLRVAGGGLRGAFVGAVTAGVSEGAGARLGRAIDPGDAVNPSALQRMGRALGSRGREVVREGLSESLGTMAGEALGLSIDRATGRFDGNLEQALGHIALSGARDLVSSGLRGGVQRWARERATIGRRGAVLADGPVGDAELRGLQRALVAGGEVSYAGPEGFARLRAEIALGRELVQALPPGARAAFAGLPPGELAQVHRWLSSGEDVPIAERRRFAAMMRDRGGAMTVVQLTEVLRLGAAEAEAQRAARRLATREVGAALVAELPPPLRGSLRGVPLDGLEALPPEGLRLLAARVASGEPLTPAERVALVRMAVEADPAVDRVALLRNVDGVVDAGARAQGRAVVTDGDRFADLPPHAQRVLAALPPDALEHALGLVQRGLDPTPAERARLVALVGPDAARRAMTTIDEAIDLRQTERALAASEVRVARAAAMSDLPEHLRGPLSALPDSGVNLVRLLIARGDAGTPHERVDLVTRALRASPGVDPRLLLRAIDAAVAEGRSTAQRLSPEALHLLRENLYAEIPADRRAEFARVPILVVDDAQFEQITRSHQGQAVTMAIHGALHVVMRRSADPTVLREEGVHLLQARDPAWAGRVGILDEAHLARWDELSVSEQLALYRNKLDLEIDAQQRLLAARANDLAGSDDPIADLALTRRVSQIHDTLANLRRRLAEVRGVTLFARARMALGLLAAPGYLDQPARLFSKLQTEQEVAHDRRQEIEALFQLFPADEATFRGWFGADDVHLHAFLRAHVWVTHLRGLFGDAAGMLALRMVRDVQLIRIVEVLVRHGEVDRAIDLVRGLHGHAYRTRIGVEPLVTRIVDALVGVDEAIRTRVRDGLTREDGPGPEVVRADTVSERLMGAEPLEVLAARLQSQLRDPTPDEVEALLARLPAEHRDVGAELLVHLVRHGNPEGLLGLASELTAVLRTFKAAERVVYRVGSPPGVVEMFEYLGGRVPGIPRFVVRDLPDEVDFRHPGVLIVDHAFMIRFRTDAAFRDLVTTSNVRLIAPSGFEEGVTALNVARFRDEDFALRLQALTEQVAASVASGVPRGQAVADTLHQALLARFTPEEAARLGPRLVSTTAPPAQDTSVAAIARRLAGRTLPVETLRQLVETVAADEAVAAAAREVLSRTLVNLGASNLSELSRQTHRAILQHAAELGLTERDIVYVVPTGSRGEIKSNSMTTSAHLLNNGITDAEVVLLRPGDALTLTGRRLVVVLDDVAGTGSQLAGTLSRLGPANPVVLAPLVGGESAGTLLRGRPGVAYLPAVEVRSLVQSTFLATLTARERALLLWVVGGGGGMGYEQDGLGLLMPYTLPNNDHYLAQILASQVAVGGLPRGRGLARQVGVSADASFDELVDRYRDYLVRRDAFEAPLGADDAE